MSSAHIHDPDSTYRFVRVHGILDSIKPQDLGSSWLWVTVRTLSGTTGISIKTTQFGEDELSRLINAEVVIYGIVIRTWGTPRSFGAHVSLRNKGNLKVLSPPPKDPFAAASRTSLEALRRRRIVGTVEGVILPEKASEDTPHLSVRQREILSYVAKGLTSRDIAETLSISYETVKDNLKKIFGALGTSTRAEAVSKALTNGLISG